VDSTGRIKLYLQKGPDGLYSVPNTSRRSLKLEVHQDSSGKKVRLAMPGSTKILPFLTVHSRGNRSYVHLPSSEKQGTNVTARNFLAVEDVSSCLL